MEFFNLIIRIGLFEVIINAHNEKDMFIFWNATVAVTELFL